MRQLSSSSASVALLALSSILAGCGGGGGGGGRNPEAETQPFGVLRPSNGAVLNVEAPRVVLSWNAALVESDTLKVTLDGAPLDLSSWTVLASGASGVLPATPDGSHKLIATATDALATKSYATEVSFDISTGGGVTTIRGLLLDPDNDRGIAGAEIYLDEDDSLRAITASDGSFELRDAALPTGEGVRLNFDPTGLAPLQDSQGRYSYPLYKRPIAVLPGATTVADPCYLPKIRADVTFQELADQGVFDCASQRFLTDYELDDVGLGVGLTVPSGTYVTTIEGGPAPCDTFLAIEAVNEDKAPSNLPPGTDPFLLITLQPTGMRFWDGPNPATRAPRLLPLRFDNTEGYAPETALDLFSVDHETGEFVDQGDMEVDASGENIVTIAGGLEGGSWHCSCPPGFPAGPRTEGGGSCPEGRVPINPTVDVRTGTVQEVFELPRRVLFDQPWGLELVYDSGHVVPSKVVTLDVTVSRRSAVPHRISLVGELAGVPTSNRVWYEPDGLLESEDSQISLAYEFDVEGLAPGSYPYTIQVTSHYRRSSATRFVQGELVVTRGDEGLGRGWRVAQDDRVVTSDDGPPALVRGTGRVIEFIPAPPTLELEGNVEHLPLPLDLRDEAFSSETIRLLVEHQGLELPLAIVADHDGTPGTFDQRADLEEEILEPGTVCDVFLVHFDGPGNGIRETTASIRFQSPILGMLVKSGPLNDTDFVLGQPTTLYPRRDRGIEFGGDEFAISEDGRTLTFSLTIGQATDQMRVLTAPSPGETDFLDPMGFSVLDERVEGGFERRHPDGGVDLFDASGALVESRDRRGRASVFERDETGALLAVVDPAGGRTELVRESSRVTRIVDPALRTTLLTHRDGDLVAITDATGYERMFDYDARGLMTVATGATGVRSTQEYDARGRFVCGVYPDLSERRVQPMIGGLLEDADLGRGTEEDPIATRRSRNVSASIVDELGNVTSATSELLPGASPRGTAVLRTRRTLALPEGRVRVQETEFELGTLFPLVERVLEGSPAAPVEVQRTTHEWDFVRGLRLASTAHALGDPDHEDRRTEYEWHPTRAWLTGLNLAAGSPAARHIELQLDDATGEPLAIEAEVDDGRIARTEFVYEDGVLTSTTDPTGVEIALTHDAETRSVESVTVGGRTIQLTRSNSGAIRSRELEGATTRWEYDALDRVVEYHDAHNSKTRTVRTPEGRVLEVHDAKTAPPHVFGYDDRGRLTSWTDQRGRSETYAFDTGGKIERVTDRAGEVREFVYDTVGRLIRIDYRKAVREDVEDSTAVTYGPLDRVVSVVTPETTVRLGYNTFGEIVRDEQELGSEPTATVETRYDALGQRVEVTHALAGDEQLHASYEHDHGRLVGVVATLFDDAWRGVYALENDVAGRREVLVRPSGLRSDYVFDTAGGGQFESVVHTQDQVELLRDGIVRGTRFEVASVDLLRPRLFGNGRLVFDYDLNDRLLAVSSDEVPAVDASFGSYDQVGNRRVPSHQYSDADELVQNDRYAYAYDDQGRVVSRTDLTGSEPERSFQWGLRGLLAEVRDGGPTVARYTYDGLGRRVMVELGGRSERRLFDGDTMIARVVNGDAEVFLHGPGTDELWITCERGELPELCLEDSSGSVAMRVKNDVVTFEACYGPFGELASVLEEPRVFAYRGRERDAEVGLDFNRRRYLDPSNGRFLSRDPLELGFLLEGRTVEANPYVYARNDPMRYSDPLGGDSVLWFPGSTEENGARTCPPTLEDLQGDTSTKWKGDNPFGEFLFHCNDRCYREIRRKRNSERGFFTAQCCYDECGNLTTGWCQGTADRRPSGSNGHIGFGFDEGGPFSVNGFCGFFGSSLDFVESVVIGSGVICE